MCVVNCLTWKRGEPPIGKAVDVAEIWHADCDFHRVYFSAYRHAGDVPVWALFVTTGSLEDPSEMTTRQKTLQAEFPTVKAEIENTHTKLSSI